MELTLKPNIILTIKQQADDRWSYSYKAGNEGLHAAVESLELAVERLCNRFPAWATEIQNYFLREGQLQLF